MPRLTASVAVLVLAVGCGGTLSADSLESQLESRGFAGEFFSDTRCRPASGGWHFVCTFRRGRDIGRTKGAFRVDGDRIEAASPVIALDVLMPPPPESAAARRWSAFTTAATEICTQRRRAIAALRTSPRRSAFTVQFARAAQIQRVELERLATLRPPSAAAGRRLADLLQWERKLVAASVRFRTALAHKQQTAAAAAASDVEVAARRVDQAARRFGLPACRQTR